MNFKPLGSRLKIGPETPKMVKNGHWKKMRYAKTKTLTPLFSIDLASSTIRATKIGAFLHLKQALGLLATI